MSNAPAANPAEIHLPHEAVSVATPVFTPPAEGKNIKLQFLLFNETEVSVPYRDLHLWINVNTTKAIEVNENLNTSKPK
jgi:uncharacterized membrane protein